MKKIFVTTFIVIFVCLLLVGCTDVLKDIDSYVSYLERDLYIGGIDGYTVEWIVGTDSGVPFSDVQLCPTTTEGINKEVALVLDGSVIPMTKSARRYAYTTRLSTDNSIDKAIFRIDGVDYEVPLTSIKGDTIDYSTALKAAATTFYDTLNKDYEQGFSYKVEIKLLADRLGDKPYYYYITFSKSDSTLAALVDPVKGEVVAYRNVES